MKAIITLVSSRKTAQSIIDNLPGDILIVDDMAKINMVNHVFDLMQKFKGRIRG